MSEGGIKILLVEDDAELGHELVRRLEREAWVVDRVASLAEAFEAIIGSDYRAVLLDRRLPDGDGISLVPAIRSRPIRPPIIFLTARDEVSDRIEGLDAGGDDYLVKPFAFGELLARLRVACRRTSSGSASAPKIALGRLTYDPATREACIAERPFSLPRRELALLELLMRRAGRVVLREHIDAEVYGFDADVSANAIESIVSRLRRRLEESDAGVKLRTIRGLGYLLQSC